MRQGVRFLCVVVFAAQALVRPGHVCAEEPAFLPPDCGLSSLFTLLELSGYHADLAALRRVLPPQTEAGYSMLELKREAEALGHRCRAFALEQQELPAGRAAIAFLADGTHGHFIVVRVLVGSRAPRAQILDSPSPPFLVDYSNLAADPHWTGRALVLESPGEYLMNLCGPVAAGLLGLWAISLRSVRGSIRHVYNLCVGRRRTADLKA